MRAWHAAIALLLVAAPAAALRPCARRRICEVRRVTAPGYPFPHPWPDTALALGPGRDGPCP